MPWQARALFYVDVIPELQYSSKFYARMIEKIRIYPALRTDDDKTTPIEDGLPVEYLNRIQDPGGGRSQVQYRYGQLQFITGECYLFGRNLGDDEKWSIVWREELRFDTSGEVTHVLAPQVPVDTLRLSDEHYEELPVGSAVAYRMWTPHPRFSGWPSSPMQGVMEMAEELLILTRSVHATATSRLVKGKFFCLPSGIEPPPLDTTGDEDPEASPFMQDLINHLENAIDDPGSPASLAPFVLWAEGEMLAQIRDFTLHDPATDYLEKDLRKECVDRIAKGLDMPPEALAGMGGTNHWPCDSLTEVLTAEKGFVTHENLEEGDFVLSLNHDTGFSEWVPLSGVRREHVVEKEMVRIESATIDALTTPDHRWPVLRDGDRVWTDSQGLRNNDRIIRAAEHLDLPRERVFDDSFVELVGWYISEGTCTWPSEKHCQVRIGQSHIRNPEMVATIRGTLTEVYGAGKATLWEDDKPGHPLAEAAWREDAEDRGMTLFHLNKVAYSPLLAQMEGKTKVLRREFVLSLTQEQLVLLISTVAMGDGILREGGGLTINQRDPARLQPLILACVLAGRPVTIREIEKVGGYSDGTHYYLNVPVSQHHVLVGETTRETYTGTIFCPQVPPTKSFLARRNGKVYFTGNSAWWISDDMWRSHGAPMAEQFCDDLSEAYLRPALREAGYEDWRNVVIAFDASAVVVNPDRSKDADQAIDRGELGGRGYRIMKNIPEEYAPTDEERATYLAIKKVVLGPDGQPLPDAGNPGDQPGPPDGQPGDVSEGTNLPASAFQGAAQLTLYRCRELAGSRIRSRRKSCPGCLDEVQHLENSLVASALGLEGLVPLGSPSPSELVAGGADSFKAMLVSWGNAEEDARTVARMLEMHAARTLFHEKPPSVPASLEIV